MDEQKIAREVELENAEVYKDLEAKQEIEKEFSEMMTQKEKLERKLKVLANRDKKVQDRLNPKLKHILVKVDLGDDEDVARVFPRDGKIVMEIMDRVKQLRQLRSEERSRNPRW